MHRTNPFDEHSAQYEEWFEENYHVYQYELEAVRHLLPRHGVGMEIGVGSGRFTVPLGIKIGVEPSAAMRKLAEARGIEVHDAVAEKLPFEAGCFDYALMVTTICFVDDIMASFQEAARTLKTNGELIVGFVDRDSPLGKLYEKHKAENVFYREATFYSTREVLLLLTKTGFTELETVQTVFGSLSSIRTVQEYKPGHGEGGFVVIRANKPSDGDKQGPLLLRRPVVLRDHETTRLRDGYFAT
jgi:SAM-dependent methyltransferase